MAIDLQQVVDDFADCLAAIDQAAARFKSFQPGIGPFGEPQLVKLVAECLNQKTRYHNLP